MATVTTSSPEQFLAAWERSLDPRASAEANLSPAPTRVPDHVLDFFSAQPAAQSAQQPALKQATAAPSGRGSSALPEPSSTSIDQVAQSLKHASLSMNKTTSAPPSSTSSKTSSVVSPPSNVRAASTTVASATRKSSPPSDDEHDDDHATNNKHGREHSEDEGENEEEEGEEDESEDEQQDARTKKKSKAAAAAKSKKELKAAAKAEAAAQEARKQQIRMWLDNPDFYWQVQKIDAVTKVGFAKHHLSWRFVIGTQLHELDLSHSPISGKRVIRLDGSEIVNEKTALEGQASHRVRIDSTVVEVTLVSNGWGFTSFAYELYINHQPFEAAKKDWQISIRNQLDAMGAVTTSNPAPNNTKSAARKK